MKGVGGILGMGLLGVVILAAALGPVWLTHDPVSQNLGHALMRPGQGYLLGADHLGRSVAARLIHGARHSLVLSSLCVGTALAVGTLFGMIAGFFPGWTAGVIMRLVDGFMAFPGLLLAVVLAGTLGGGTRALVLALVATAWCDYCRLARNLTRTVLAQPYVEAGRLLEFGWVFMARRYVLRSLLPQVLTLASLGMGRTILNISALGFLGIGLKPPTPEWGVMITQAMPYLSEAPCLVIFPGMAVFSTVLGFQLLANAMGPWRP